jgi:hypothetical protein
MPALHRVSKPAATVVTIVWLILIGAIGSAVWELSPIRTVLIGGGQRIPVLESRPSLP